MTSRLLTWDGCVNTRDLGGLPLRSGGTTAFGRIVRSDNIRHLSARGWEQLLGHGVRTILDLRFAEERDGDPTPPGDVAVVGISLFGVHDPVEAARIDELVRGASDAAEATALLYADTLETCRTEVAASARAVAGAGEGGVVVHCFVGKDRTGIVTALLLDIAGVERASIVADYALTEGRVGSLVDGWIADAVDPHERAYRERISSAPRAAMESLLDLVHVRYGGAAGYLRDAGVAERELEAIRVRLLDGDR